jgi:hypothetical protein
LPKIQPVMEPAIHEFLMITCETQAYPLSDNWNRELLM